MPGRGRRRARAIRRPCRRQRRDLRVACPRAHDAPSGCAGRRCAARWPASPPGADARSSRAARCRRGGADAGHTGGHEPAPAASRARRITGATIRSISLPSNRGCSRAGGGEFRRGRGPVPRSRHRRASSTWSSTIAAKSDEFGPTISLRGIDNASYYRLAEDQAPLSRLDRLPQHAQHRPSRRFAA